MKRNMTKLRPPDVGKLKKMQLETNPPYTELGKDKPYKGYEYKFQMALVEAMQYRGFEPTYTPNDANLSKAECNRLGRMGIRKGMPDLMLYRHNIAIELKVKDGSIKPEQKKTMAWLSDCGWTCFVVWSFPAAMGLLDRINKGEVKGKYQKINANKQGHLKPDMQQK